MNTSRIGAEYERAYRHELEGRGYQVSRSAASKGPFDLIALGAIVCWHVQLKAGKTACSQAQRTAAYLRASYVFPSTCRALVVHKLERERFCEHVG